MSSDETTHDSLASFPAQTSALRDIRAFVQAELRGSSLPAREHNKVVMAVDEAIANIIEHGYRDTPAGTIGLSIDTTPAEIRFTIRDTSPAFDPNEATPSDVSQRVMAGNRRGYGLHLMQAVMDTIEYVSHPNAGNDLLLIKRIPAASPDRPAADPPS